ncbi:putative hemolysin [Providencia huaxiensis]|uniref:putative hemolysin n=1 Tax=Providencia huaxiensis TaxID=2027290 RepID=UPI0034DD6AAB
MKKIFIFTALIAVAGCVSKNTKTEPQQAVGMPNPASVYCVQSGGKSETVDTPSGQVGYYIAFKRKNRRNGSYIVKAIQTNLPFHRY